MGKGQNMQLEKRRRVEMINNSVNNKRKCQKGEEERKFASYLQITHCTICLSGQCRLGQQPGADHIKEI